MFQFIQDQLKHNPFFLTAFIGGSISVIILFFKNFGRELYNMIQRLVVFSCAIYQNDQLFSDFEIWFYAHYGEKYRNVEASVNETTLSYPVYAMETNSPKVYFKQSEGVFLIKYHGKFILIKKGREKMEHAVDARSFFFNQYHFFTIRGAKQVKALLDECMKFSAAKSKANELKILSNSPHGDWMISGRISSKKLADVIINAETKKELITDMSNFLTAKEEYDRRHIFYKRGYCFYGDPGNGKTSLALAMASYLQKDIYNLDLNSLNENGSLKNLFVNMSNNSCLLIEDIDCFFNLRETIRKDSKISFSTFLNCLDGVMYKEGLVTIITTNKLAALDPALIRTGRIDFMKEIPKPGTDEINRYLQIFYDQAGDFSPIDHAGILSMCDVQETCLNNNDNLEGCINEIKKRSSSIKKAA